MSEWVAYDNHYPQEAGLSHWEWLWAEWKRERERSAEYRRTHKRTQPSLNDRRFAYDLPRLR